MQDSQNVNFSPTLLHLDSTLCRYKLQLCANRTGGKEHILNDKEPYPGDAEHPQGDVHDGDQRHWQLSRPLARRLHLLHLQDDSELPLVLLLLYQPAFSICKKIYFPNSRRFCHPWLYIPWSCFCLFTFCRRCVIPNYIQAYTFFKNVLVIKLKISQNTETTICDLVKNHLLHQFQVKQERSRNEEILFLCLFVCKVTRRIPRRESI